MTSVDTWKKNNPFLSLSVSLLNQKMLSVAEIAVGGKAVIFKFTKKQADKLNDSFCIA